MRNSAPSSIRPDHPQVPARHCPRCPRAPYGVHVTSRDQHRSAVYAAEEQWARQLARGGTVDFFGSPLHVPTERRFADIASVQAYVDAVLSLIGVVTQWPGVGRVRVRERAGNRRAHYSGGIIALPIRGAVGERWAARESVVLHELTHHLVAHAHPEAVPHGPQFCGEEIRLVEIVLGPEAALLLRAAFDGARVPVAERIR
jgi:putative metallohydrolase (TIGR04338 family)